MGVWSELFEQLTPEQEALVSVVRDEWLRTALAIGPADRPAAEHGARLAYERTGLEPPSTVIWLDSPLRGAYAIAMIWLLGGHFRQPDQGNDVKKRLAERVNDPLWNQVWDQINPQTLGEVGKDVKVRVNQEPLTQIFWPREGGRSWRLEKEVEQVVRAAAWEKVGKHVQQRIADHFGPKVWADVWPELRDRFHGHVLIKDLLRDYGLEEFFDRVPREVARQRWHHEWEAPFETHVAEWSAGTLAYCDTLARLGMDVDAPLDGLVQVARSAGWWWYPLKHAVILTERPTALHLDADGRLHHPNGPAITYPDGFVVHARHGTVLPAPITTPTS